MNKSEDSKKPATIKNKKLTYSDKIKDLKKKNQEMIKLPSGEFRCPFCDKTLIKAENMQAHINFHTGEKSFNCKYCDMSFARNSNLSHHVKKHHNSKVKRFFN